MDYDRETYTYKCVKDKKLPPINALNKRSGTGYISEKTIYICEDCSNCPYKKECIKGSRWKVNLKRVISKEGIMLRINRSIQVEGFCAQIKQDMGFSRYLSRGRQNVLTESNLLAIGSNINKLHRKIQNDRFRMHFHKPKICY